MSKFTAILFVVVQGATFAGMSASQAQVAIQLGAPVEIEGVTPPNIQSLYESNEFNWLGVDALNAPILEERADGNFIVRTKGFELILSADGEVMSRRDGGTSSSLDEIGKDYAPYQGGGSLPGIVNHNRDSFTFTQDGVPIPSGGLTEEARKAVSACISNGQLQVEEARLMDSLAGEGVVPSYEEGERVNKYLTSRGVKFEDLQKERSKIYQKATQRHKAREAKARYAWEMETRYHGAQEYFGNELGPAEEMSAALGPYIVGGLIGAGGSVAGLAPVTSTLLGVGGTNAGDLGAYGGAAYGNFIDETGTNPFIFTASPMTSPRPDASVWDSMGDAFDKLWGE